MTLTTDERKFLELFHNADEELQGIIWRLLPLAVLHGMPFLEETEGPALARDRGALLEVIQKWEAK